MISKYLPTKWLEPIAIATGLGGVLFSLQWKYGFNVGDEGWLWYVSQQLQHGEMPLRDVFSYDPGRYVWSVMWFRMLGADGLFEQRLANAAFGILGLTCAYSAMLFARIKVATRIAIALTLALALCYPLHKVYEQSLSLIGVALVACTLCNPSKRRWWLVLGVSVGIAACIGRNSGLYIGVASLAAVATTWRLLDHRAAIQAATHLAGGVLAGYSPMLAWFAKDNIFRHAMIESIIFTPKWQLPLPIPFPWRVEQSFSNVSSLQSTAVSWLAVLAIAIYLAHLIRLLSSITQKRAMTPLLSLEAAAVYVGIPYLHQSFDRADFPHMAQGLLPLFILAAAQLSRQTKLIGSLPSAFFLLVASIAWLPSQPILHSWMLKRENSNPTISFPIDGHNFELSRSTAMLLKSVGQAAQACHIEDGQLVAMPHFPGILAYLHVRSPYWEMYYLYPRDSEFQLGEIRSMEKLDTKIAIVDWSTALDGRQDLRFDALNPLLGGFIRANFTTVSDIPDKPDNVNILVRDCPQLTSIH